MNDVTRSHTVHSYDQELGHARGLVLEMGAYVLEQARKAVKALTTGDTRLAQQVVNNEPRVDHFERDADEAIFNLIAKRQPAAVDLRLPRTLGIVMFTATALSFLLVGIASSADGKRDFFAILLFALAFVAVLIIIVDLDRPQQGLLTVSQTAMEDLLRSMATPVP